MNLIFMTVLSMSLSGAVLISILFLGGRLLKGRLSRQWQYYIWLIAVMRLLLPFGPEVSLMGRLYQAADSMIEQMAQKERPADRSFVEKSLYSSAEKEKTSDTENREELLDDSRRTAGEADNADFVLKSSSFLAEGMTLAKNYLWVIWLALAFGMLIRKITVYQSYIKYVTAGAERVCEVSLLDRFAVITEQAGIARAVELCVNPLVSSPMLVGYLHPCIVLPGVEIAEKDFHYIVMHELTHYKRRDIFYKWLLQVTVCLHWFNPLVHLMNREIDRACEFSCDEAVITKMGYDHAGDYGKMLLDAMAAVGTDREPSAAVTLNADKRLLKERLGAIMNCERKTKKEIVITAGLTVGIALGTFFLGVYPTAAAEPERAESGILSDKPAVLSEKSSLLGTDRTKEAVLSAPGEASAGEARTDAERYYQAGSLPMFHIAFNDMNEKEQEMWLDRIYADREIDFFSVSVWALDADSPLIQSFAEKFYEDGDIAFFSVLADQMEEDTLERWLDQALADQKWNFQSMLYDRLGREEEKDALEKAMDEQLMEAYQAVGVTWNGKNCYYKGQLVNIFLDIHMPNRSSYRLDMNPAGKVNIKIVRSAGGQITGVAYMNEAEVEELLGDLYGEEFDDMQEQEAEGFPCEMVVAKPVCNVREGAGVEFKVVCMLAEGDIVNVLGKKEDSDGRLWYLLTKEPPADQPNASVKTGYIRADLLRAD